MILWKKKVRKEDFSLKSEDYLDIEDNLPTYHRPTDQDIINEILAEQRVTFEDHSLNFSNNYRAPEKKILKP